MRTLLLVARETMAQRRAKERLALDCNEIVGVINRNPGVPSKADIARQSGLTTERVARCLRHINSNEAGYQRVEYGENTAKDGAYAGATVRGWWPSRYSAYQKVLNQADEHSSRVELGVRRSRLIRLAYAHGLTTREGERVVASIEARLAVDVEALSVADYDAFIDVLAEEFKTNGTEATTA